jgi:trehalose 6-phosphate synthase
VLILSKFAGAAEELTDALIVNPNDKIEVAEAIQHALHMSWEERVTRWQAMSKILWNSDVSRWAAAFVKDLATHKTSRDRSRMMLARKDGADR